MADPFVRVAILGTGKIAQDWATALRDVSEAKLVAVGSRSKDSALWFGDKFQVQKSACYGNYQELAKADGIDLIYISSPHSFHYEHAILCLHNNKNVLCEKAVTINAKQLESIIKIAKERNLFFMEAMWMRYMPKTRFLIEEILPALGTIHWARADFGFKNPGVDRLTKPELGGGALLDIGIYAINLCYLAFGDKDCKSIQASGIVDENHIDHAVQATFEFEKGFGQIFVTIEADTPKNAVIVGENGSVTIHEPFWCGTKLTVSMKGESPVEKIFPLPPSNDQESYNFLNSVLLQHETRYACQQILAGAKESELFGLDKSLQFMKIFDSIRAQIGVSYPNE